VEIAPSLDVEVATGGGGVGFANRGRAGGGFIALIISEQSLQLHEKLLQLSLSASIDSAVAHGISGAGLAEGSANIR
jgi:hypothetical protein